MAHGLSFHNEYRRRLGGKNPDGSPVPFYEELHPDLQAAIEFAAGSLIARGQPPHNPDKPILCVDFDGVIHSYTSGWKGATAIPDPVVPGAIQALREYTKHFTVCIYSSRSKEPDGVYAMRSRIAYWAAEEAGIVDSSSPGLEEAVGWIYRDLYFPITKPAAFMTIDDRAHCFTGQFPSAKELREFRPWNKKG